MPILKGLYHFFKDRRSLWIEGSKTFSLGWPIILTNLAQMGMGATDVAMLGRVGADSLGAATLGVNLYNLPMLFGLGVAQVMSPMVAHVIGERSSSVREVRRTVRQGFWAVALLCLPLWMALWQARFLLSAMGQDSVLVDMATGYVHILQWALLPMLGFFVLRSSLAALGKPKQALVVTILSLCMNVIVNYILIFGHFGFPALGVNGAAWGSLISSCLLFAGLLACCYLDRHLRRYALLGHWWRLDWIRLREVLRLGLPIGCALAFEIGIFNATVFLMGLLGEVPLAAHAIAVTVSGLSFMIPAGLAQAAAVRVALFMGQGNSVAAGRAGWVAFAMGESMMVIVALVFLCFPAVVIYPFLKSADPAAAGVAVLAAQFLAVAGVFQVFDGAQVLGAGMLRGLKDTQIAMIFAAFGYWIIGLPVGVLLAFKVGMGGVGLWGGLAAGLGVVSVLMIVRWVRREALGLIPLQGKSDRTGERG